MVWVCVCFDMGRVKQRSSEPQRWKVLMMKTCLKKNTPNFASHTHKTKAPNARVAPANFHLASSGTCMSRWSLISYVFIDCLLLTLM